MENLIFFEFWSPHITLSVQTQSVLDKVGLTAKDFAFNPRNKYAGEISFLLKMFPQALEDQMKRYRALVKSVENKNLADINEQIYRLAGLVIIGSFSSVEIRRLVRMISWSIAEFEKSILFNNYFLENSEIKNSSFL